MLLEADADKDSSDHLDRTALMQASVQGHVKAAKLLVEAGANTNLAANFGSTALMMASGSGHAEVVRLLLEASADQNLADNNGQTALRIAFRQGHGEVGHLLARNNGFDAPCACCRSLWHLWFGCLRPFVLICSVWLPAPSDDASEAPLLRLRR